eukprot:TRINITY_DN27347_c0_g1_i1.p1 TRINITY_DN27347_c0_g1~~TRINITY_DN27347_c0_g1_i1.p1  ORF type:complete len:373 (-),score=51.86 TRINITY_DN27347_c0_g1_i1:111-1127(-)
MTGGMLLQPLPVVLGPVAGGIVAGVLHTLLGPDHICTIVTLSACQGSKAFWFGVRWAAGHLAGMTIIGLVFAVVNVSSGGAAWEVYEHYVDYFIGFMLLFFGVYFIMHTEQYFDQEWSPKQATCECHAHLLPDDSKDSSDHGHGHSHSHGHGHHSHGNGGGPQSGAESRGEKEALLPASARLADGEVNRGNLRTYGSTLAGFLQGIACPAGIVGMSFLKHYTLPEMAMFIMVFFIITTFSMGCLAMLYGVLTQRYISSASLARSVYYFSCGLSIVLGIAFITLNAFGVLDDVMGHDHDHGAHGHAGHDHAGHDHHHHHHEHDGAVPMGAMLLFAEMRR